MAQTTVTGIPTVGDCILAWRKFRGLRSTELAEKAGVRSQYLSEIEHNRTANPKEEYLVKLADALGVPLQDIYGRRMPLKERGRKRLKRATGPTPSLQQSAVGQPTQKASSPSTRLNTSLPTPHKEILMHRLAVLKEKVEAAEKNVRDTREEVLEIEALAVDIFGEE